MAHESFLNEIWACCTHLCLVLAFHESFLREMVIPYRSVKVSHYTVYYSDFTVLAMHENRNAIRQLHVISYKFGGGGGEVPCHYTCNCHKKHCKYYKL